MTRPPPPLGGSNARPAQVTSPAGDAKPTATAGRALEIPSNPNNTGATVLINDREIVNLTPHAVEGLLHPRSDLLVPDTGPDSAIRDERGQIVAVRRLRLAS